MLKILFGIFVSTGLLDKRETNYFNGRETWVDINIMYVRWAEDQPPIITLDMYPWTIEQVNGWMTECQQTAKFLKVIQQIDLVQDVETAIQTSKRNYEIYDALRDSKSRYFYVFTRRQALGRMKSLMGLHDFTIGRLPKP